MKERVIKSFIDKDTKEGYNEGSFYESDDKERVEFLQDEGYLYKGPETEDGGGEEGDEDKEPSGDGGPEVEEDDGGEEGDENKETSEDGESNDKEYPYHKGGGNYVLSNGDVVKGKDEAIAAQEELDKEG